MKSSNGGVGSKPMKECCGHVCAVEFLTANKGPQQGEAVVFSCWCLNTLDHWTLTATCHGLRYQLSSGTSKHPITSHFGISNWLLAAATLRQFHLRTRPRRIHPLATATAFEPLASERAATTHEQGCRRKTPEFVLAFALTRGTYMHLCCVTAHQSQSLEFW